MDTRKLLFAAAALLGAAAVVAQVEPPADFSVGRSTSAREGSSGAPREARGGYERSASTATRDASGARTPAEDVERPDSERMDERRVPDSRTRPQAP